MKKKDPKKMKSPLLAQLEDIETMAVSSTECTGLIPSMPKHEEEIDSYKNIQSIPHDGNMNTL